jgi:hypothetical protein
MFRLALAVMGLTVFAAAAPAQDSKSKQGVHKDSKDLIGWIVKVDSDKQMLTILKQDGKQTELTIDGQTKLTTPQGAAIADGLKDKQLTPGTHVKLVMGDGTAVKEVHMLIGGRRAVPAPARAAKKAPAKEIEVDPKNKEEKKDPGTKEK